MNIKFDKILQVFKSFLTFFIANIIFLFIYSLMFVLTDRIDISYIISYTIMIIALFLINKDKLLTDLKNIKSDHSNKLLNIIIVTLIFYLLVYISNKIIFNYIGDIAVTEKNTRELFYSSKFLMFISIGILGPIFEELTVRYPYRDIKINKYLKLFIYTFIFAIMHLLSITNVKEVIYIIPYILLSLEISYSYFKTNNIYGSIIMHILNNSINLIILLLI